jgi:hypothetical protein
MISRRAGERPEPERGVVHGDLICEGSESLLNPHQPLLRAVDVVDAVDQVPAEQGDTASAGTFGSQSDPATVRAGSMAIGSSGVVMAVMSVVVTHFHFDGKGC